MRLPQYANSTINPTAKIAFLRAAYLQGVTEIAEAVDNTKEYCHRDYAMDLGNGFAKICTRPLRYPPVFGGAIKTPLLRVELHGDLPADPGWLFGGTADLIAFQVNSEFLLVDRKVLCSYVNKVMSQILGFQEGSRVSAWVPLTQEFYRYPDLVYTTWKK